MSPEDRDNIVASTCEIARELIAGMPNCPPRTKIRLRDAVDRYGKYRKMGVGHDNALTLAQRPLAYSHRSKFRELIGKASHSAY